jgi:outer membrane lipoprotein-sorting protein
MSRLTRISRRLAVPLAALLLFGAAAAGTAPAAEKSAALNARDKSDIARIEAYLNTIRTIRAGFIQTATGNGFAEGRFYLSRPGKLRFDYLPAGTTQLFADGLSLIHVDHELEQVTYVPLSTTPAGVLIDDKVRLSGKLTVTRIERGAAILRLRLIQNEDPDSGALELTFSDRPLALLRWTVFDAQGVTTRLTLVNPEFNAAIDDKIFVFEAPEWTEQFTD